MKQPARVLALTLIAVLGCRSQGPAVAPVNTTTFEGLEMRLKETVGGAVIAHPSDRQNDSRRQYVDVDGKLRLSFAPPPGQAALAASPEWRALEQALETFDTMLADYQVLTRRAESLPAKTTKDTAAWQAELRSFWRSQKQARDDISSGENPLLTPDELRDALNAPGPDGFPEPYAGIANAINGKQEALRARVNTFADASDEFEVTVRATIDPQVGKPQQLQIPGYFAIDDETGSLESANVKRDARFRKLKAEKQAATEFASSVRELQAKGGEIEAALTSLVDKAEARVKAVAEKLRAHAEAWPTRLEAIYQSPSLLADGSAEASKLTEDLQRLKTDLDLAKKAFDVAETVLRDAKALDVDALLGLGQDDDVVKRLNEAGADFRALFDSVAGTGADPWSALIPRILTNAGKVAIADTEATASAALSELKDGLAKDLKESTDSLTRMLPETAKAFERIQPTFQSGNALLKSVDEIEPKKGDEIPHKLGADLPDAVINLAKTTLTHGDDLDVSVRFWELEDGVRKKDGDKDAEPIETIQYTMKGINEGWVWSGDLIFTRGFSGNPSDNFVANAAASYEWRFFNREDPFASVNWWRPGVGFHAAQLNFESGTAVEFGVGVNGSLWDGLLRGGFGYDISISDDQGYWFFGFGVLSALDKLSVLSNKEDDGGP